MSKPREKVSIISRENNYKSLDIRLLEEELLGRGIEVDTLTKRLTKNLSIRNIGYIGHIFKQIRSIATSKVVVVDTYCIPVSMMAHDKETTVIQIWHALSAIKKFGWQTVGKKNGSSVKTAKLMNMHRGYDQILCSSDVTANYFCEAFNSTKDKIVKIGLPRIDYILTEDSITEEKIRNQYQRLKSHKTILYVPTFRGGKPVDVRKLAEAIDFDKYTLIVKLHPIDKASTEKLEMRGVIYDEIYDTYDMLKVADIVISDYSSLVVESSLLKKPLYLYTYDEEEYKEKTGLNVDFRQETIGKYSFRNADELLTEIERSYDYKALEEFRDKYVDVDTENCTKQLADHIEKLLER